MTRKTARTLYKKLLTLYPRAFREQFGESMTQTFNDLYHARQQQTGQGVFSFVLWLFAETTIGIIKEHAQSIRQGDIMNMSAITPRSAAIISFLLVLPLMILELVNRRSDQDGFPIPLFGLLFLLPMLFFLILKSMASDVQAGSRRMTTPAQLLLLLSRVALLALIAVAWGGILMDQLPCFLGVPNCD